MSSLKELESLESFINNLGDEPNIMARRGEKIGLVPSEDIDFDNYYNTQESVSEGDDGQSFDSLLAGYESESEAGEPDAATLPAEGKVAEADLGEKASEDSFLPAEPEEDSDDMAGESDFFLDDEKLVALGDESGGTREESSGVEAVYSEDGFGSEEGLSGESLPESATVRYQEDDTSETETGEKESALEVNPDQKLDSNEDAEQEFSVSDLADGIDDGGLDTDLSDFDDVDLEKMEAVEPPKQEDDFSVSDEDFQRLKLALVGFPLSMKLSIESLLADDRWRRQDVKAILHAILSGRSPRQIIKLYTSITGLTLKIPRNYRRYFGRIRMERLNSVFYRTFRMGSSISLWMLGIMACLWVLGMLAFMFVYRPIKAASLYRMGLEAIERNENDLAVWYFNDAWYGWPFLSGDAGDDPEGDLERISDADLVVSGWKDAGRWLEYARKFRAEKYLIMAERFYRGYFVENPTDRIGRLEFADFLGLDLGRFEEAVSVFDFSEDGLSWMKYRAQALGDLYFHWAELDVSKYEDARFHYAKVLELNGRDDRGILSMARYHLRVRNDAEIELFIPVVEDLMNRRSKVPELAADVYAGLGEFLLRRDKFKEARKFIDSAILADVRAVKPRYVDTLYWERVGDMEREFQASADVLVNLDNKSVYDAGDLRMRILALGNMGRIELAWSDLRKGVLDGQGRRRRFLRERAFKTYTRAVEIYEDALRRNQLGASPEFGHLYLGLGDLMFGGYGSSRDLYFSLIVDESGLVPDFDRLTELEMAKDSYSRAKSLFDQGDGLSLMPEDALYRYAYSRYVAGQARAVGLGGRTGVLVSQSENMEPLVDDETIVDLYRLANMNPDDYDIQFALATVLLEKEDYSIAANYYLRVLALLDERADGFGEPFNPGLYDTHRDMLLRYVATWNNLGVARAYSTAWVIAEEGSAGALGAFLMASNYLDEISIGMDFPKSSGAEAIRNEDSERISRQDDGYFVLNDEETYPYRNRLRMLGLEDAEKTEGTFFSYLDIPSSVSEF